MISAIILTAFLGLACALSTVALAQMENAQAASIRKRRGRF